MRINSISFGQIFKTREVAEIVAGKEIATNRFLSDVTGISENDLLSCNHSDMFIAGSNFCGKKISELNPEFKTLNELASAIRYSFASCGIFGEKDTTAIQDLFEKRDKEIETVCTKLGETVDIPNFSVPFLREKN